MKLWSWTYFFSSVGSVIGVEEARQLLKVEGVGVTITLLFVPPPQVSEKFRVGLELTIGDCVDEAKELVVVVVVPDERGGANVLLLVLTKGVLLLRLPDEEKF